MNFLKQMFRWKRSFRSEDDVHSLPEKPSSLNGSEGDDNHHEEYSRRIAKSRFLKGKLLSQRFSLRSEPSEQEQQNINRRMRGGGRVCHLLSSETLPEEVEREVQEEHTRNQNSSQSNSTLTSLPNSKCMSGEMFAFPLGYMFGSSVDVTSQQHHSNSINASLPSTPQTDRPQSQHDHRCMRSVKPGSPTRYSITSSTFHTLLSPKDGVSRTVMVTHRSCDSQGKYVTASSHDGFSHVSPSRNGSLHHKSTRHDPEMWLNFGASVESVPDKVQGQFNQGILSPECNRLGIDKLSQLSDKNNCKRSFRELKMKSRDCLLSTNHKKSMSQSVTSYWNSPDEQLTPTDIVTSPRPRRPILENFNNPQHQESHLNGEKVRRSTKQQQAPQSQQRPHHNYHHHHSSSDSSNDSSKASGILPQIFFPSTDSAAVSPSSESTLRHSNEQLATCQQEIESDYVNILSSTSKKMETSFDWNNHSQNDISRNNSEFVSSQSQSTITSQNIQDRKQQALQIRLQQVGSGSGSAFKVLSPGGNTRSSSAFSPSFQSIAALSPHSICTKLKSMETEQGKMADSLTFSVLQLSEKLLMCSMDIVGHLRHTYEISNNIPTLCSLVEESDEPCNANEQRLYEAVKNMKSAEHHLQSIINAVIPRRKPALGSCSDAQYFLERNRILQELQGFRPITCITPDPITLRSLNSTPQSQIHERESRLVSSYIWRSQQSNSFSEVTQPSPTMTTGSTFHHSQCHKSMAPLHLRRRKCAIKTFELATEQSV